MNDNIREARMSMMNEFKTSAEPGLEHCCDSLLFIAFPIAASQAE